MLDMGEITKKAESNEFLFKEHSVARSILNEMYGGDSTPDPDVFYYPHRFYYQIHRLNKSHKNTYEIEVKYNFVNYVIAYHSHSWFIIPRNHYPNNNSSIIKYEYTQFKRFIEKHHHFSYNSINVTQDKFSSQRKTKLFLTKKMLKLCERNSNLMVKNHDELFNFMRKSFSYIEMI